MRIALFHDLPSGGAKRVLEAQARRLRAMGHEVIAYLPETADETFLPLKDVSDAVHVFSRGEPPDRSRLLASRVGVLEPARWLLYMRHVRAAEREIAQAIDDSGHDLVLVHPSQFTQAPCLLRYLRTPSLYYCHEPLRAAHEPWFAPPWLSWGLRHTIGRVDASNTQAASALAVNSRYTASRVRAIYGRSASVARPGIDCERFRPSGRGRRDFALAVGALHPAKGLAFVLDVLAQLPSARRPPLVVVSDRAREDERHRIRAQADDLGVTLILRHQVDEHELVRLYNEAAVVIYAPHDEPLGLVPLEAMACEAPVIGVAEGGVMETIVDGVTGLLAPRDVGTFASGLQSILEEPDRAAALGKEGRAGVLASWSWDGAIAELDRLCRATARSGEMVPEEGT